MLEDGRHARALLDARQKARERGLDVEVLGRFHTQVRKLLTDLGRDETYFRCERREFGSQFWERDDIAAVADFGPDAVERKCDERECLAGAIVQVARDATPLLVRAERTESTKPPRIINRKTGVLGDISHDVDIEFAKRGAVL